MPKLVIHLCNASFSQQGTYFIKLEVFNLSTKTSETIKLRTDVSGEETTHPEFQQSKFQVAYDSTNHTKLILTACSINQADNGSVVVTIIGSSEVILDDIFDSLLSAKEKSVTLAFITPDSNRNSQKTTQAGQISVNFTKLENLKNRGDVKVVEVNSESSSRATSGGYARILLARSLIDISKSDTTSIADENNSVEKITKNTAESDNKVLFSDKEEIETHQFIDEVEPTIQRHKPNGHFITDSEEIPFTDGPLNVGLSVERYNEFSIEIPKERCREPFFISQGKNPQPGQLIIIQVHDLWDLPCMRNATTGTALLPTPFVTAKSSKDAQERKRAKAATHVHAPAREASFGEVLYVDYKQAYSQINVPTILLTVADNLTKRIIAKFAIPISVSFFPSHRQLNMILRSVSPVATMSTPHARVSITSIDTLISSPYIMQREYEDKMVFLEVILKGFLKTPLPFEVRSIAVLRVVSDGAEYISKLKSAQRRFNEGFAHVVNPLKPHLTLDFDNSGKLIDEDVFSREIFVEGLIYNRNRKPRFSTETEKNYYQMSCASGELDKLKYGKEAMEKAKIGNKPVWNQHFVFVEDMNSFTPGCSLIIEYYREPGVNPSSDPFKPDDLAVDFDEPSEGRPIDDIFAYSIIPLGDFTVLPVTDSGQILNLERVKVNFIGKYEKVPGTSAVFCCFDIMVPDNWHLVRPRTPPRKLSHEDVNKKYEKIIPDVETVARKLKQIEALHYEKRIKDRKKVDPLPDMSFDNLIKTVRNEREKEKEEHRIKMAEKEISNDPKRLIFTFHDIEQRQKLIDRLMQELDARTSAVKKIGGDLYAVREANSELEQKIKILEQKISENEVKTVQLLNTVDIDVIPIEEVKRRYALLAQKLQLEINRTRDLSEKLENNQLKRIESNELEKKYLEIKQAHKAQAAYIQNLQECLKQTSKYKSAITKQEQVIQKLEVLLKDSMAKLEEFFYNAKMNPDTFNGGVYRLLTEENQMLKEKILNLERSATPHRKTKDFSTEYEIQQLKEALHKEQERYQELERQMKVEFVAGDKDVELFKLLMRAEKAESRVKSLEQELSNSAKSYAKQLTDLKLKLSERGNLISREK
ncbi:hypothetical protein HDU92_004084, partial [Lobulomyces angularis]